MTTTTSEFPAPPYAELFGGRAAVESLGPAITAANAKSDPGEAFFHALTSTRLFTIDRVKSQLAQTNVVDEQFIRAALDAAWMAFRPRFQRLTAPMIAEAYIGAFRDVQEGNVPIKMIYALADEHAARVGGYFNATSTEALIAGFNAQVNKQVPRKAALARVLEAFGLSPRQMSGYIAMDPDTKVNSQSTTMTGLRGRMNRYLTKSLSTRFGTFMKQERHNLDQQAQQVAWMWLVENGKIPKIATKKWHTAKDEKVCKQCGPLDGVSVPVGEQFELPNGNKLYVPGAHVNCRCVAKLEIDIFSTPEGAVTKRFTLIRKDNFDPKKHPRGGDPENPGRFSRKQRARQDQPETAFRKPVDERLQDLERAAREMVIGDIPEVAEVAEPVEEKPKKASFGAPAQAPRKASFGATAKPKASFGAPKAEAKPAEPRAKASFGVTPTQTPPPVKASFGVAPTPKVPFGVEAPKPLQRGKVSFGAEAVPKGGLFDVIDPEEFVRLLDDRITHRRPADVELHPRAQKQMVSITVPEFDGTERDVTAYLVGHTDPGERAASMKRLTRDDSLFVPDQRMRRQWLNNAIETAYDLKITQATWDIMQDGNSMDMDYPTAVQTEDGEFDEVTWTAEIPRDVVVQALRSANFPDELEDDVEVKIYNPDDTSAEPLWEPVSLGHILNYLEVNPDDLMVHVFEMEQGYGGGKTYPEQGRPDIWHTEGDYEIARRVLKDNWTTDTGRLIPYRVDRLRPREEEIGTREVWEAPLENPWVADDPDDLPPDYDPTKDLP